MIPRKFFGFAVIIILLLLSSCGNNAFTFAEDGDTGNLIDEENDLYYVFSLGYLRAAEIYPHAYAQIGAGRNRFYLHEIPGLDPKKWLSENIETEGMPFLFREQNVEEPTLENFETDIIYITLTGEITLQIGWIDDDRIEAIVNDFVSGEQAPAPDIEFIEERLILYFASEKYRGIYYVLEYWIAANGNNYLYDRWTGRWVLSSVSLMK